MTSHAIHDHDASGRRILGGEQLFRRQRAHALPDLTVSAAVLVIMRRWWLVLAVSLSLILLATLATIILSSTFVAEGFLVVDPRRSSIPEIGVVSVQAADPRIPRSEAKVLTAPAFTEELAGRLKLDREPFIIKSAQGGSLDVRSGESPERAAAANWLQRNLKVRGEDRSYAITVAAGTPDPMLSAKIVNAAMTLYLERRSQDDAALVERASRSISERFNGIRAEVSQLERQILEQRNGISLVGTNAGRVDTLDLVKLIDEQRENERQLSELTEAVTRARAAAASGRWQDLNPKFGSPYLTTLLEQEAVSVRERADVMGSFGPNHPDVINARKEQGALHARMRGEINRIAEGLAAQIKVLQERQAALGGQIDVQRQASVKSEQSEERIHQLEDELTSKRALLATYETRLQQLTTSVGAGAGAVRVGAWSTPPSRPSGPSSAVMLILAGIVGAILGVVYVLLERRFGDRLESAEEIVAIAGLPVVGAIPEIKTRVRSARLLWSKIVRDPHGVLAESIRALLVRLQFALPDGRGVVLVTSPRGGDGKTSLCLALAEKAVTAGRRVLLIDADFFRRGVTRAAGIALEPGQSTPSVVEDGRSGLHILPAGRARTPIEQSQALEKLTRLIADARNHYDLIVIDTPPIMHVSDATLLAPKADTVLLVTSWKSGSRSELVESLDRLEASGSPIAGIVLSKLPRRLHRGHAYGGYGVRRSGSSKTLKRALSSFMAPEDWNDGLDLPVVSKRARAAGGDPWSVAPRENINPSL